MNAKTIGYKFKVEDTHSEMGGKHHAMAIGLYLFDQQQSTEMMLRNIDLQIEFIDTGFRIDDSIPFP